MRLAFPSLFVTVAVVLAVGPAYADCIDQVPTLKARIAREKDAARAGAAKKQLMLAEQNLRGSETECRNAVTRANRILSEPTAPQQAQLRPGQRPTEPAPGKPWNSIR